MPAQRPSAAFEPISPDLDLQQLVEDTPNFEYVTRISCEMIAEQGYDVFDKLVLLHVIIGGKPLVIEGFHHRLDEWTFTSPWLQDNCGKKCIRDEAGRPTKPGSSIWFMTETNDRHMVSEYWLSRLGHDIEVENHFAQINAWKLAPFKTYIVDQRAGDFILIPPLAPHQVWNRGTRTMKAAWNRTTVETLEMALHEALPRARMVCRDEQYKNRAIIYFALQKYSDLLKQVDLQRQTANAQIRYELDKSSKIRQLQKDFWRLFALYTEVLLSEMLAPVEKTEKRGQYLPYDSFVTCSYCRCNIFNRFLTCTSCVNKLENGDDDTYDICMDCFVMGRSCWCISKYKWVEQFPWQELAQRHDAWRQQIVDFEGAVNSKAPQDLQTARKNLGKKTIAQICQEQLKARPWQDPKKPAPVMTTRERHYLGRANPHEEEIEVEVDDNGKVKKSKSKKTRAEKLPKGYAIEHVSHYPELLWKLAACTKCDRLYSYGSLYRMFDLQPQQVLEDPEWECPACRNTCSCGACRRRKDNQPYEPKGTFLGHDTKKVADSRSVDSLVNYGRANLHFIEVAGDDHSHHSRRLSRRKDEAEKAKAQDPDLDEHYVDDEGVAPVMSQDADTVMRENPQSNDDIPIDPMLSMDQPQAHTTMRARRREEANHYLDSRSLSREESMDWDADNNFSPPGHHGAPFASMMDHGHPGDQFVSNGITYEYPDPTMSQSGPPVAPNMYNQEESSSVPMKPMDVKLVQSEVAPPVQNGSGTGQTGGQLSQLEKMLEEAKLNDRYISTEATFTGKSLKINLFAPSSKLAVIVNSVPQPRAHKVLNTVAPLRKEPPILLQSDYPSASQPKQTTVPRRKRVRKETDNDFSTRKRRDRRSSVTKAMSAKDTRRNSAKYTEISSESEAEALEAVPSFVPVNKSRGSRPLPKYLAERTEENLPTSLDELSGWKAPTAQMSSKSESAASNSTPKQASNGVLPTLGSGTTKLDTAQKRAEDNAKAKMKALRWQDEDEEMSSASASSETRGPAKSAKTNGGLLAIPKSIFTRAGPNGKKKKPKIVAVKTVSANDDATKEVVKIARRSLEAL
ncbi:hypothetical protein P7C71_g3697, partial [Lecanoromycetidae sp. Uapishka_2]